MARETLEVRANMSDRVAAQNALAPFYALEGPYKLTAEPFDPKRSNQANAYYHAVPVRYFRDYMAKQGQHFTHDQCHEYLRDRFLYRAPIIDPRTGEVIDYMPASSAKLGKADFYTFVEDVRDWLWDTFKIKTPDPQTWGVVKPTASMPAGSTPQRRLTPCAPSTGDVGERPTHSRQEKSNASR